MGAMPPSRVLPYVPAVSSVGLALLLNWFSPTLSMQSPSLLFVAAIMVSAWAGGWVPGFLAVALSTVALHYFLPPIYSFAWDDLTLVRLTTFMAVAGLIAWLNGQRHRAAAALHNANALLEQRVQERTAELARANAALQARIVAHQQTESQLKGAVHEREILLREFHHRVKNNLQIIRTMLRLQAGATQDPRLGALVRDSEQRIQAMVLVHDVLYRTRELEQIELAAYLRSLLTLLGQACHREWQRLRLHLDLTEIWLDIDRAVSCGLTLNELVTNCFKHAFPDGRAGEISITLQPEPSGTCTLTVRDTGIGLPAGLEVQTATSLGLQLVGLLTQQLGGTLTCTREGGTTFTITFPLEPQESHPMR